MKKLIVLMVVMLMASGCASSKNLMKNCNYLGEVENGDAQLFECEKM